MRKTLGLIGFAGLLLVGCSSTADQERGAAATEPTSKESSADALQVSGAIHAKGDNALYMSEDNCIAGHPALAEAMSGIEGSQVTVLDAEGATAAVTEFETKHSEDECVWFFNAKVDGTSNFYSAEFLEVETPTAAISDADDGVLMLDPATPLQEQAQDNI